MGDPNLPAGCSVHDLPNDFGVCSVCLKTMEVDGDSDGVRQWMVYTCRTKTCPESPDFNEEDPEEER